MSTIPFTQRHDPDDVICRELTSKISMLGLLCLIVMERLYPALVSADRLAYRFKVSDKRKTLDPVLADLWTYGYASHTGADHWRITDIGRQAVAFLVASTAASTALLLSSAQPAQPTLDQIVDNYPNSVGKSARENLRADLSSSDQIDRSISDRSSIDLEEEQREKISWLDRHNVGGEKRRAILASPLCTAARLDAMLTYWQREGHTANGDAFRSQKYGPLNYAIACALDPTAPTPELTSPVERSEDGGGREGANRPSEKISEPESDEDVFNAIRQHTAAPAQPIFDESKFAGTRMKPTQIWQAAQGELQLQMAHATYDTWVKRTAVANCQPDHLTIAVPSQYIKDWWDQRLMTTVTRILTGIVGRPVTVEFVVHPSCPQK